MAILLWLPAVSPTIAIPVSQQTQPSSPRAPAPSQSHYILTAHASPTPSSFSLPQSRSFLRPRPRPPFSSDVHCHTDNIEASGSCSRKHSSQNRVQLRYPRLTTKRAESFVAKAVDTVPPSRPLPTRLLGLVADPSLKKPSGNRTSASSRISGIEQTRVWHWLDSR